MSVGFIAIQTLLYFVSYTMEEKSSAKSVVLVFARTANGTTGNADPTCLLRNPPVVRRDDYTYFPGIGGYKLHSQRVSWNQARITCEEEGGHLAIINSLAERDAVVTVLKAINPNPAYVSLGFHDLYQEGHYVTIHEQTLTRAGFNQWARGEPNNFWFSENCGSLHSSGGLNDHRCRKPLPFVCEHPIH
ncbi:hemolymph lipopolysaccharide-binding protein [Neodiprion lecontei]|uniref:Hemolymph lipopolysaccharide-binding protein n=1 Tax=Neodiprion lecontei TaxID=441921 RepID=A0A6J0CAA3_NEOLC|nr:hemolymph lipopolysaccharide-binding protein [Neodiprion lecontei]XP_046600616.1 hemolymph lipopolysaccharide-binding protein [Neodiprion lecontei]